MENKSANTNILILGASGLLGYHCFEELSKKGYNLLGTYHSIPVISKNLVKLDASDVASLKKIIKDFKPAFIINTIAFVTVDGCEIHPEKADYLNNKFVSHIVDTLKESKLDNCEIIQISSDSVYGSRDLGKKDLPWIETDETKPLSVYAQTKLAGEFAALEWKKSLILRCAFYGINPYSSKSLLWWIIENAMKGNALEGWENIYFSPISASELSKTITTLIEKKVTGLYNVGSNDICNKYDFVSLVCQSLELPVKIDKIYKIHDKAIRPNYSVLDSNKLAGVLNWNLEWRNDLNDYLKNMPPFPNRSL